MGWTYVLDGSRSDVVAELIRPWSNDGMRATCLRHALRGNVLWTVWELTRADGRTERCIRCDVLQKWLDGWGYKSMEESMGPCYDTCPLEYLDLVPSANEAWRERVRAYHARRREQQQLIRSLRLGDRVRLQPNAARIDEAKVAALKPLTVDCGGRWYRVPQALIAEILPRDAVASNL